MYYALRDMSVGCHGLILIGFSLIAINAYFNHGVTLKHQKSFYGVDTLYTDGQYNSDNQGNEIVQGKARQGKAGQGKAR